MGTAAVKLTREGYDAVSVLTPGVPPHIFVPDKDGKPADIPAPTMRADSPTHALQLVTGNAKPPES